LDSGSAICVARYNEKYFDVVHHHNLADFAIAGTSYYPLHSIDLSELFFELETVVSAVSVRPWVSAKWKVA